MKQLTHLLIACVFAAGSAALLQGCEEEIARTSETEIEDDGTVETEEKSVTRDGDGEITVTEEKTTTNP